MTGAPLVDHLPSELRPGRMVAVTGHFSDTGSLAVHPSYC